MGRQCDRWTEDLDLAAAASSPLGRIPRVTISCDYEPPPRPSQYEVKPKQTWEVEVSMNEMKESGGMELAGTPKKVRTK